MLVVLEADYELGTPLEEWPRAEDTRPGFAG